MLNRQFNARTFVIIDFFGVMDFSMVFMVYIAII